MATIKAKQGQRLTFNLDVKDPDGNIIDLSAFTATLKIKSSDKSVTHGTFTSAGGDITLAATSPNVQVVINTAVTQEWNWYHGIGDMVLTRIADGQILWSINLFFEVEKSYDHA